MVLSSWCMISCSVVGWSFDRSIHLWMSLSNISAVSGKFPKTGLRSVSDNRHALYKSNTVLHQYFTFSGNEIKIRSRGIIDPLWIYTSAASVDVLSFSFARWRYSTPRANQSISGTVKTAIFGMKYWCTRLYIKLYLTQLSCLIISDDADESSARTTSTISRASVAKFRRRTRLSNSSPERLQRWKCIR